jgi:hypothetical protein
MTADRDGSHTLSSQFDCLSSFYGHVSLKIPARVVSPKILLYYPSNAFVAMPSFRPSEQGFKYTVINILEGFLSNYMRIIIPPTCNFRIED